MATNGNGLIIKVISVIISICGLMAGICFYFGGRIATAETKASDDRTIIRAEFRAADEKLYDRIDARQIRMENKLDKIYLELKK